MTLEGLLTDIGITSIAIVVTFWDVVSYPFYCLLYKPWQYGPKHERKRAKVIKRDETSITVYSDPITCPIRDNLLNLQRPLDTLDRLFDYIFERYGDKKCLGTRDVFKEEKEVQKDGRLLTKLELGEYRWITYAETARRADDFARGLRHLGFRPRDKVVIYAETKAKWLISAIGCFRSAFTLVTIFTNLGDDGVVYGLNQTDAKVVITSHDLLPKLKGILKRAVNIHTVIYFEKEYGVNAVEEDDSQASSVNVYSFNEVLNMGEKWRENSSSDSSEEWKPRREDIAVIMYTSGSTGNPKGALLTHANICSEIIATCPFTSRMPMFGDERIYIAYLPAAHILELTMEIIMLVNGISVGYSGPNTLTDAGSMVKAGQMGDARALKPTLLIAVPVILDRIFKGIQFKLSNGGLFKKKLFAYCYQYRSKWTKRGFDTPIMKRLVFSKVSEPLGGRLLNIICGGAPLSEEVHHYLETVLCAKVSQGYGLTESSGGIALSDFDDYHVGEVGYPLPDVYMKLENWEEGGYRVTDQPAPRGEIHIGGSTVALGYYNMINETTEAFYKDEEGRHWFKTGDVGQLQPTGAFKIIDRRKDLVKLQMGEYVSLGKVEGVWKVHPLVESVCAYAEPTGYDVVAIVVPDEAKLKVLAMGAEFRKPQRSTFADLCSDPAIRNYVTRLLREHSASRLEKFEIPKKVHLSHVPWLPDTGLVTASLKLKRRFLKEKFQKEIDVMFSECEKDRRNRQLESGSSSNKGEKLKTH